MLLSIVECSDSLLESDFLKPPKRNHNKEIEIIGPVLGPNVAAMRNRGARAAKGRWIFFKDKDCRIPIEKIIELIMKIETQFLPFSCIGGRYQLLGSGYWMRVYHRIQRQWVHQGLFDSSVRGLFPGSHLLGGALLVKKQAFDQIEGFCERIGWGGEERDFVKRLQEQGFKTAVSFSLCVVHENSMGFFGFLKRAWFQNFNGGYFRMKRNPKIRYGKYLRTQVKFFAPTFLFFFLGYLGLWFGQIARLMNDLKSG